MSIVGRQMTDAERLYAFLEHNAEGRDHAMRQADVARRLGWMDRRNRDDTRRVQYAMVSLLAETPPRVVCSAIREPMGIFVPRTLDEAMPYLRQLHERGIECLKHERAVRQALAGMFGAEIQDNLFQAD